MTKKTRALLIIDPQNCFMDLPGAPLPVAGATADMRRVAGLILENPEAFDAIYVSQDLHPADHIAHAVRWKNWEGKHPDPFTIISYEDVLHGIWSAANAADQAWQLEYTRLLAKVSNRAVCIWPVHGQADTWEQRVVDDLHHALNHYEYVTDRKVSFCQKGLHRDTEQYGLFAADVPIYGAPETFLNVALIDEIDAYDEKFVCGEASSHCVMDSFNQIGAHVGMERLSTYTLISDCMSPVGRVPDGPDFPRLAGEWQLEMASYGVNLIGAKYVLL